MDVARMYANIPATLRVIFSERLVYSRPERRFMKLCFSVRNDARHVGAGKPWGRIP